MRIIKATTPRRADGVQEGPRYFAGWPDHLDGDMCDLLLSDIVRFMT